MRPLKFRVRNVKRNEWTYGPHADPRMDGVNILGEVMLLGCFMAGTTVDELNDCRVLQYTGIQDKNGKEIFEGDILRSTGLLYGQAIIAKGPTFVAMSPPEITLISEVIWDKDYASFLLKYHSHPEYKGRGSLIGIKHDSEVIGNIFDTPDLIK